MRIKLGLGLLRSAHGLLLDQLVQVVVVRVGIAIANGVFLSLSQDRVLVQADAKRHILGSHRQFFLERRCTGVFGLFLESNLLIGRDVSIVLGRFLFVFLFGTFHMVVLFDMREPGRVWEVDDTGTQNNTREKNEKHGGDGVSDPVDGDMTGSRAHTQLQENSVVSGYGLV